MTAEPTDGSGPGCDREPEVVDASRSGHWPAELDRHTGDCPDCAETRWIAEALRGVAPPDGPLTDAGGLWARLDLRVRREAAERAERPVMLAHRLALAALTGCAWVTVSWTWQNSPVVAWVVAAGLAVLAAPGAAALWFARD